jgi:hypothetical protein
MKAIPPLLFAYLAAFVPATARSAEPDAGALAKAVQNPVADLISVPFQYNANFDYGPREKTQHVLNIQPVYPINLSSQWNLITRTIVPLISQPAFTPSQDRENGIGDVQLSLFLSPAQPTGWIWGVGAIAQFDTASDDRLGQGKIGLGPTAVALKISGPWVTGALINNVWSVAGDDDRPDVNQMLLQPFVNYNFPQHPGRYLTFSPIVTANWEASGDDVWTVPVGLGIGQILKLGKLPVNLQASAYWNVVKPDFGADWQLRLQAALLFPK